MKERGDFHRDKSFDFERVVHRAGRKTSRSLVVNKVGVFVMLCEDVFDRGWKLCGLRQPLW